MKVTFHCDPEKCSACNACAVACMDQNDIDIAGGQQPFRTVVNFEEAGRHTYMSISCMHCDDAPCVRGCPTGSLYKDESTGLTLYDPDLCVGCHSCAMACPYGEPTFISFDSHDRMLKCDGCIERLRHGMEPACVRVCPVGALTCEVGDGIPSGEFCLNWPRITIDDTTDE